MYKKKIIIRIFVLFYTTIHEMCQKWGKLEGGNANMQIIKCNILGSFFKDNIVLYLCHEIYSYLYMMLKLINK